MLTLSIHALQVLFFSTLKSTCVCSIVSTFICKAYGVSMLDFSVRQYTSFDLHSLESRELTASALQLCNRVEPGPLFPVSALQILSSETSP